jgi:hypothetical protein
MSIQNFLDSVGSKPAPSGNCLCPGCGAAIPLADVNVSTDRALCRACGRDWSYQAVASAAKILAAPKEAPKGVVEESKLGCLRLTVLRRPKILWILIPFFLLHGGAFAGVGIATLTGHMRNKDGSPGNPLFGLFFAIPGILELLALAVLIAAKWTLTLEGGQGSVHYGIGRLGWTRRFTLSKDSAVFLAESGVRSNNRPMIGVCVETLGKRLVFCSTLPDDVKHYLAATLLRTLRRD